jgi:hypothetical protein
MKLDQETVVKHQFWFLLGGYFVLWLTAVLWMKFSYPSEIEDLKKKYDGAASGVKTALSGGPVNTATFLPPWDKETKEFSDHKGVIWGDAWHVQEEMYDWPAEWVKKYGGMKTPQVQISPDDRNDYKEKLYPNQVKNLRTNMPKILNPVELKDGFDEIFQPKKDWREIPTREEIWLAQEDFWIKRELLYVVYWCVAQQAVMEPVEIDEKKEPMPKGVEARQRYRNKNWEITLNLRKSNDGLVIGGDSTIKNIHPSHQPQALTSAKGQGIWFNIGQDAVRTTFEVRGEPIGWNEKKNFSEENYRDPLSGFKWDKDYLKEHPIFVSQGFDQTNSPIRRINAMELSKQDCRTFIWPLQPNHLLAALDALPEDQDPAKKAAASSTTPGGGSNSGDASGMMAMMTGSSGRPGGATATAPAGNLTPNNDIERDRYLQPTEMDKKLNPPSHHLPMAIQLIVEQAHMHDIMLALANSRLRFQITQVEFKHEKDYVPQSDSDKDKKDGPNAATPKMFTGNMSTMMGGMARGSMGPMAGRPGGSVRGSSSMRGGPPMGGGGMGGGPPMGGGSMRGGGSGNPMMMMMMMQQSGGAMGGGPKLNFAPGAMRGTVPTPAGTDPNQAASNQPDDNLVELTIYGISTLYREPDAPQTTAPAGQSGTPAQQQAAPAAPASGAATPPATTAQPDGATKPPAATAPPNGGSPAQASPKQSSGDAPAPKAATPPPSAGAPTPPKQPDKNVEQQKAPPPPPPPADKKR